jgi:tetratricopeptide (TPR) repeat protein
VLRLSACLLALALDLAGQSYREQRLISELQQDPQNVATLLALGSLKLDEASAITKDQDRAAGLDEVQILYLRANSVEPRNPDILYHLGIISWMKVFPAVVAARREVAMEPETPGPVRDRSTRAVLNAKYRPDIEYAIASLEQAIAIDPANNAAMAYLQMAYRARADLKDTRAEWDRDQNAAAEWRDKAFEVGSAPTIDPQEMEKKLRHSRNATCPADLNIVGEMPSVTLNATIDRDGSVLALDRGDGPLEGEKAAIEAAKTWDFQPTLQNGKPTIVKTSIVVAFDPCSHPAN